MGKLNILCLLCIVLAQIFCGYCLAEKSDSTLRSGIELYEHGDYEKSIDVLKKCQVTAEHSGDKKELIIIYNNLGNNYTNIGESQTALAYYQRSLSIAEGMNDKKSVAKSLNNIGTLYSEMKDFDNALKKFGEAEAAAIVANDTFTIADCANNTGLIFEQLKNYDAALTAYRKAIRLYDLLKQDDRIAILYNNLGIVYKYLGQFDTSIGYYTKSLEYSRKIGSKFLVAANLINIGNVYEMKGDYNSAIRLNEEGLKTGEELRSQELVMETLENLSGDYAHIQDYKKAYGLHLRFAAVRDSFINVERSKSLAEMQTKYETQKKENRIIVLEKSRLLMISISIFLVLLLVISALLYSRQNVRQKAVRELAIQEAEQNERRRIARDIHDDIGSGLSTITMIAHRAQVTAKQKDIGTEGQTVSDTQGGAALVNDVLHIAAIVRDLVGNIRDMLWLLGPENSTVEQLVVRIREYCHDTLDDMDIQLDLQLPEKTGEIAIKREVLRNLFLTIKEALNNSLKYAEASRIVVFAEITPEGGLRLSVTDNGKGISDKAAHKGGNGLRNMKERIVNLGGTFTITSDHGTTVTIDVPRSSLLDPRILL